MHRILNIVRKLVVHHIDLLLRWSTTVIEILFYVRRYQLKYSRSYVSRQESDDVTWNVGGCTDFTNSTDENIVRNGLPPLTRWIAILPSPYCISEAVILIERKLFLLLLRIKIWRPLPGILRVLGIFILGYDFSHFVVDFENLVVYTVHCEDEVEQDEKGEW